jgi:hypothetical protein
MYKSKDRINADQALDMPGIHNIHQWFFMDDPFYFFHQ